MLFRGTFATQRPGGPAANRLDVYVKNTSNTNVVHWGGRLWSLFEAGQPYRLDPATLQTQASGAGAERRTHGMAISGRAATVCLPLSCCCAARSAPKQAPACAAPHAARPTTLQGLETLGGQVRPGLPFDLGTQAANEGFSRMVRGIHQRLGSAAHMPPELFSAGGACGARRAWQGGAQWGGVGVQPCFGRSGVK